MDFGINKTKNYLNQEEITNFYNIMKKRLDEIIEEKNNLDKQIDENIKKRNDIIDEINKINKIFDIIHKQQI